jgi:Tfp pilus assembly protein PilX
MRLALRQRGQLLVAGIVLIVVIALMIGTLAYLYVSSERSSTLHGQSGTAYFVARSGLESAIYQFSQLGTACAALVAAGNTNVPVDTGSFTITAATLYPSPGAVASTLTGAGITTLTPGVITATSIANFAPHGRIRIENEEIDYSSTSASAGVCGTAPCFISWRRGANGTTAANHAAGVSVFQDDQCLIQSTGCAAATCPVAAGVGVARRTLEATVK